MKILNHWVIHVGRQTKNVTSHQNATDAFQGERAVLSLRLRQNLILFVLGLIALALSSSAQTEQAIEIDVCTLAAHPKQFDKKRVQVRAEIISSIHGSALVDSKGGCGVGLWYADSARDDPSFKALHQVVLHERSLGSAGKPIVVVFTGQFLQHAKDSASGRKNLRVLVADQVENIVVGDMKQ